MSAIDDLIAQLKDTRQLGIGRHGAVHDAAVLGGLLRMAQAAKSEMTSGQAHVKSLMAEALRDPVAGLGQPSREDLESKLSLAIATAFARGQMLTAAIAKLRARGAKDTEATLWQEFSDSLEKGQHGKRS